MNITAKRGEVSLPTGFLNRMLVDKRLREEFWSKLVPVKIEHSYMTNSLVIHAYCEEFDELEQGVITPLYQPIVTHISDDDIKITFKREGV